MFQIIKSFALLAVLAVSAMAATYTQSVNNSSYVAITRASHGFSTGYFGVHLYNSGGALVESGYTFTYDSGTGTIAFTFSPSNFTGTIKLTGEYSSDSSPVSNAFKPVVPGGYSASVVVCSGASASSWQAVTVNSKRRICLGESQVNTNADDDYTIRVWMEGQKLVFGHDGNTGNLPNLSSTANGHAELRSGITSFPGGVVQIAEIRKRNGQNIYTSDVQDKRSWQ